MEIAHRGYTGDASRTPGMPIAHWGFQSHTADAIEHCRCQSHAVGVPWMPIEHRDANRTPWVHCGCQLNTGDANRTPWIYRGCQSNTGDSNRTLWMQSHTGD